MKSKPRNTPKTEPPPVDSFRLLFHHHPLPMWIYDLGSLAFLEVNDTAVEKYGYRRDEFLQMTLRDIRPEEDVKRLLADVKKKRSPLQYSGEWRHRLKDGRIIAVEITSHTLEFRGHKAALVTVHDITDRKQAEEALTESEARYRGLFEDSPVSLWEEDFSAVKKRLDGLRKRGVKDFRAYFKSHPQVVKECAALVQILDVNN